MSFMTSLLSLTHPTASPPPQQNQQGLPPQRRLSSRRGSMAAVDPWGKHYKEVSPTLGHVCHFPASSRQHRTPLPARVPLASPSSVSPTIIARLRRQRNSPLKVPLVAPDRSVSAHILVGH